MERVADRTRDDASLGPALSDDRGAHTPVFPSIVADDLMNLVETLGLFASGIATMAVAVLLQRRPHKPFQPRLPTMPFLFLGTVIMVLAGVHLLTFLH